MVRWAWVGLVLVAGSFPAVAAAAFVPRPELQLGGNFTKAGATLADLDGDGHLDVMTEAPTIWWGLGDGTFEAGPDCDYGMPVVADFDNDGRLDVLRIRDEPVLCRGEDGRAFSVDIPVEPSPHAGMHLDGNQIAYAGAGADFDGDGWVDVYVTQYEDFNIGKNFADIIYGNDGGQQLLVGGQIAKTMAARGVQAGDYDGDGDPDVYVSNYRVRENLLFENDGNGSLTDVAEKRNAAGEWAHTISSPMGDLDNDGDMDIVIGNFAHPGQPSVAVLLNEVEQSGAFVDIGDSHNIEWVESYASFALADYDNDLDLDLFITTVYEGDHGRLYRNLGDGTFEDVTEAEGLAEQTRGYGLSLGDVDGDGFIDVVLGGTQEANLYLGEPNENHWIQLDLRGDGLEVNAAAVGARVTAHVQDRVVLREVFSGGNGGDRGGSPLRIHMGLGAHDAPVELEIAWPWAETCTYVVDIDTLTEIQYEPDCDGSDDTGTSTGSDDGGGDGATTDPDTSSTTAMGSTSSADTDTAPAADDPEAPSGCACSAGRDAPRLTWLWVGLAFVGTALRPRRRARGR